MIARKICVLGGTGFVGSHLVGRLVNEGWSVSVLTRHKERHKQLGVLPTVHFVEADIHNELALQSAFQNADLVINLTGILNETKKGDFDKVHVELPGKIIRAALTCKVSRVLHMSALNADADHGPSRYLRTKGLGEKKMHAMDDRIKVTSFRPSVIFGPGDSFFTRFARLLRVAPGILPLACPNARFAPVYVGDVVEAFIRAIDNKSCFSRRYELCGPADYSLRELVEFCGRETHIKCRVLGLSAILSRLEARIMEWLPGQPQLSIDNILSMQVDSVCTSNSLKLFGIRPASIETVVPAYLGNQKQILRYSEYRRVARHE